MLCRLTDRHLPNSPAQLPIESANVLQETKTGREQPFQGLAHQ